LPVGGQDGDASTVGDQVLPFGFHRWVDGDAVIVGGIDHVVDVTTYPLELGVEAIQPGTKLFVGVSCRVGGDHDHVVGVVVHALLLQGQVDLRHGHGAHVRTAGVSEVQKGEPVIGHIGEGPRFSFHRGQFDGGGIHRVVGQIEVVLGLGDRVGSTCGDYEQQKYGRNGPGKKGHGFGPHPFANVVRDDLLR